MAQSDPQWAIALFNRSVLKQAKFREILAHLDDPEGKTNLDIGADNGIISYLMRQRGGRWSSADLDPEAVASIRGLVGDEVHQLDGCAIPFSDSTFDQVVVVDFLEHIQDDREFVRELARILKPGGTVVINVPHLKPRSLLNRFRHRIGLTDEWHGHLRPGYTLDSLRQLLDGFFVIERASTYSRAFSELIDTALNGLYELLRQRRHDPTLPHKGTLVTQTEMQQHRKQFRILGALYPFFWTMSKLDALLPLQQGYKLIVRARRIDKSRPAPLIAPSTSVVPPSWWHGRKPRTSGREA